MAEDEHPVNRLCVGKEFATMIITVSGLDDILAMPPDERDLLLLILAISGGQPEGLKANDLKKIRELANDIAARKFNDVLSGKEMSVEWRTALSGWVYVHSRKQGQGRPETNYAFRRMVMAAVNVAIQRNPNRLLKEILGEAAGHLDLGGERIRQLDPTAGMRLRNFRKTGNLIP
jgi:hypothetical protein